MRPPGLPQAYHKPTGSHPPASPKPPPGLPQATPGGGKAEIGKAESRNGEWRRGRMKAEMGLRDHRTTDHGTAAGGRKKVVHPPQCSPPSAVVLRRTGHRKRVLLWRTGYGGRECRMQNCRQRSPFPRVPGLRMFGPARTLPLPEGPAVLRCAVKEEAPAGAGWHGCDLVSRAARALHFGRLAEPLASVGSHY